MILSLELRKGRVGGGKDLMDPLHLGEEVILEPYSWKYTRPGCPLWWLSYFP